MKESIAKRWVAALRSGKFSQTTGYLHREDDGYCCLGVLCELAVADGVIEKWASQSSRVLDAVEYGVDGDNSNGGLPVKVLDWAEMGSDYLAEKIAGDVVDDDVGLYDSFAELNDTARFNFDQIAEVIDDQWERL